MDVMFLFNSYGVRKLEEKLTIGARDSLSEHNFFKIEVRENCFT